MKAVYFACALGLFALAAEQTANATTYEIGPDKPYTRIGDVPWASLLPGDTVLIYWRPTPYKEKWVICRQGTADAPITVRGVPGPGGELPVIDGNGAQVQRTSMLIKDANPDRYNYEIHEFVEGIEPRKMPWITTGALDPWLTRLRALRPR